MPSLRNWGSGINVCCKCMYMICVCDNMPSLQLSILVHPDKNDSDRDRAQLAFDGTVRFSVTIHSCDNI